MRGFHTAALVAVVALALCAGGAADTNTPQTRGAGASNIGTAGARPSLNITTTAERPQGSDAGKFTRGRRPKPNKWHSPSKPDKWHSPSKPDYPSHSDPQNCNDVEEACKDDSDCLKLFPCKFATCEKKHKKKNEKKYRLGRSDEDDKEDHPENYERYYDSRICVCGTVNKVGPCLPPQPFPNDCTSIQPNIGICDDDTCTPVPRDNGCNCGAFPDACIIAEDIACLYSDQPCKCNGDAASPNCVPNLLPVGTICYESSDKCKIGTCDVSGSCITPFPVDDGTPCHAVDCAEDVDSDCLIDTPTKCICDTGVCGPNLVPSGTPCTGELELTECEVAQCQGSTCVKIADTVGTPCFDGGQQLCINAGTCIIDDLGMPECQLLDCEGPKPSEECASLDPGQSCTRTGKICCPLPNFPNDGNQVCITTGSDLTCPCSNVETTDCVFKGGDQNGFCCSLGNGEFECKENEGACPPASACADRRLGDACLIDGISGICCVDLQNAGTFKNPNLLCNKDTSTCECGTCEFKDTAFGTNKAYCSATGASASEPCIDSCSTCSVQVQGPILNSFCDNANTCVDEPDGFANINQLCPGSTSCIACKTESSMGGCAQTE